ncbi:MAG: transposase family protein [Pseudomonadota bacterium]
MKSFAPILTRLETIADPGVPRVSATKQRYILLFAILAIVTGADSYRGIHTFIRVHLRRLNKAFGLGWKRPPAHASIRSILSGLDAADVEVAFRVHAAELNAATLSPPGRCRVLAIDVKALRGSFDAFHDGAAKQMPSAFAADTTLRSSPMSKSRISRTKSPPPNDFWPNST